MGYLLSVGMGGGLMIHIWNEKEPWPTKVNFIQDYPMVILGYDMQQNCCENFSWHIEGATLDAKGNLPHHIFDVTREPEVEESDEDADELTYSIRFFLKGDRQPIYDPVSHTWSYIQHPDASIVLINCHNGYYAHGWELLSVTKEGEL